MYHGDLPKSGSLCIYNLSYLVIFYGSYGVQIVARRDCHRKLKRYDSHLKDVEEQKNASYGICPHYLDCM